MISNPEKSSGEMKPGTQSGQNSHASDAGVVPAAEAKSASKTFDGVTIVIPAYNEEHGIGGVLDGIAASMEHSPVPYEVIVVDDGSSDATGRIAQERSWIRLVRHRTNRGYGAALKTGIRHAHYGLICITDGDGTYPNERIPDMLTRMLDHGYDMVVGARIGADAAIPWTRRPAKWVLGKFANIISGEKIPDLNSGLRIFRRSVALRFLNILPDGFSFTTTITLGMLSNGYEVEYVPIEYHGRIGKSKLHPIKDPVNFLQLVVRVALYFAPLKFFMPLSVVMLLVAIAWGFVSKFVLDQFADVSTLLIVMTAVQIAVIGVLAELINRRLPNFYREEEDR